MTRLNLNQQFPPPPANENISWRLAVKTRSRRELIHLSAYLARAFKFDFLHDVGDPPIIMVPGWNGHGKSMIVEAMMKTLLDQTDPLDMLKPGASKALFIEDEPVQAMRHYCYAAGTCDGVPVLHGFDRVSERHKPALLAAFGKAAAGITPAPRGGAIFGSNGYVHDDTGQWLTINLHSEKDYKGWDKNVIISVESEKLRADPKFRRYWTRLQQIAESGDLSQLTLPAAGPLKTRFFTLDSMKNPIF